jgi:hypothetical protein
VIIQREQEAWRKWGSSRGWEHARDTATDRKLPEGARKEHKYPGCSFLLASIFFNITSHWLNLARISSQRRLGIVVFSIHFP